MLKLIDVSNQAIKIWRQILSHQKINMRQFDHEHVKADQPHQARSPLRTVSHYNLIDLHKVIDLAG